jgi:hypothetical protein
MKAHVLIFKCQNCGRPMPLIRLDAAAAFPDQGTMTETAVIECLGPDCKWAGEVLVVNSEANWTIDWPHLKGWDNYKPYNPQRR